MRYPGNKIFFLKDDSESKGKTLPVITCQSLPRTAANICEDAAAFFESVEDTGAAAAAAAANFLLFAWSNLLNLLLQDILVSLHLHHHLN
jgi:hypothetical protein